MSDTIRIATRDSYGKALVELGRAHDNIVVLDADLADSTKTGVFKKEFPERHFDCGIAEQNMVGVAAGLSTMGLVPFVSSFAMFLAGRAYEQVRNIVGYSKCNVKLCASHAGNSVGEDGATHQCLEDIALMRSIPGMVVINPADDVEAQQAVKAAYEHEGPVYIRLGRLAVPVLHGADYRFQMGKGNVLKDGSDLTIIATGLMVKEAMDAAEMLQAEGISARVINIATIKPLDEELILQAATETGRIITAEEHSIVGGLGEAVCSLLSEKCPTKVKRLGTMDVFGKSGAAPELLKRFGLSAQHLAEMAEAFVQE